MVNASSRPSDQRHIVADENQKYMDQYFGVLKHLCAASGARPRRAARAERSVEQANIHIPMEMKRPDYGCTTTRRRLTVELHFDFYEVFILLSSAAVPDRRPPVYPDARQRFCPSARRSRTARFRLPVGELYERVDIYIRPSISPCATTEQPAGLFSAQISRYGGNLPQAGEHTRQRIMDVIDNLRTRSTTRSLLSTVRGGPSDLFLVPPTGRA